MNQNFQLFLNLNLSRDKMVYFEMTIQNQLNIFYYLNSSKFLTFLKNNGKVWQGKNKESSYFSLSMRQLKNIFS